MGRVLEVSVDSQFPPLCPENDGVEQARRRRELEIQCQTWARWWPAMGRHFMGYQIAALHGNQPTCSSVVLPADPHRKPPYIVFD